VPVTIKENVDQEGCATTKGVVGFQNIVAKVDSPIVANWKRAGAIIVGRTNTPAFSFRLDTVNKLRARRRCGASARP
jgi:amidase